MNQCPKCYRDMTPIEECGFCGHRAALPSVRSEPLLADWIRKIQTVNRRSEHFNSVIETFCTEALSDNIPICVYPKSGTKPTSENAAISGTVKGPVGDIERSYCLGCRREIPTESGHLCPSCAKKEVSGER